MNQPPAPLPADRRVAFLVPGETRAGAGQRALHLCRVIADAGWIVDQTIEPAKEPGGVERNALAAAWTARRPTVVYIEVPSPWGEAWRRVATALGIPFVVTWHVVERFDAKRTQALIRAANLAFCSAAAVVLVESQVHDDHLTGLGFPRLFRLPKHLDAGKFSPAKRSNAQRAAWGAGPITPVVLHVGRLLPQKNITLLARTLRRLHLERPHHVAVVIGDGPELPALKKLCPWVITPGIVTGEALAVAYASADLFLFPVREESWGNVIVEALASGLPVVAFPTGCVPEVMTDGVQGRIVHDDPGFADAALTLVGDLEACRRLGAAAPAAVAHLGHRESGERFSAALAQAAQVRPLVVALIAHPAHASDLAQVLRRHLGSAGTRLLLVGDTNAPVQADTNTLMSLVADIWTAWESSPPQVVIIDRLDLLGQAAFEAARSLDVPVILRWTGDHPGLPGEAERLRWHHSATATLAEGPARAERLKALGVPGVIPVGLCGPGDLPPAAGAATASGGSSAPRPGPRPGPVVQVVLAELPIPSAQALLPAIEAAVLAVPGAALRIRGPESLRSSAPRSTWTPLGSPLAQAQAIGDADLLLILPGGQEPDLRIAIALAAGVPVLAVAGPAADGLFQSGAEGWLVARPEALVPALAGILIAGIGPRRPPSPQRFEHSGMLALATCLRAVRSMAAR